MIVKVTIWENRILAQVGKYNEISVLFKQYAYSFLGVHDNFVKII